MEDFDVKHDCMGLLKSVTLQAAVHPGKVEVDAQDYISSKISPREHSNSLRGQLTAKQFSLPLQKTYVVSDSVLSMGRISNGRRRLIGS